MFIIFLRSSLLCSEILTDQYPNLPHLYPFLHPFRIAG